MDNTPILNDSQVTTQDEEIAATLQNLSNEEAMAVIAKGLLQEKGFSDLDEETEGEMIQDLVERMTDFVNRAVLEELPEEKMAELDQMIAEERATDEEVGRLIQESGVDASAATMQALEKFREVYLNGSTEE